MLDTAVATYFAGPASFTGEDTVEFCCHGGMLVVQRVTERLLQLGARPAEPGEFSRRAFENGRMDLAQAEAVMDVISADRFLNFAPSLSRRSRRRRRKVREFSESQIKNPIFLITNQFDKSLISWGVPFATRGGG